MGKKLLQINFKLGASRAEYEQLCLPLVQPIADVAGLRWKVWIINEEMSEAGGLYLFEDEISLQAYLNGPIVAGMGSNSMFIDVSAKVFDVMDAFTQITRGPVLMKTTA